MEATLARLEKSLEAASSKIVSSVPSSTNGVAMPCPSMTEAGFDAIDAVRATMAAARLTSPRQIILAPGQGTTGSTSLAHVLINTFGLRILHGGRHAINLTKAVQAVGDPAAVDYPRLLAGVDAVLDTPTSHLFPYLMGAFPNAVVLHTLRDSMRWVKRRRESWPRAPLPLGVHFGSLEELHGGGFGFKSEPIERLLLARPGATNLSIALAYSIESTFIRCSVPPKRYLALHVLSGDLCNASKLRQVSTMLLRRRDLLRPRAAASVAAAHARLSSRHASTITRNVPGCNGRPAAQQSQLTTKLSWDQTRVVWDAPRTP